MEFDLILTFIQVFMLHAKIEWLTSWGIALYPLKEGKYNQNVTL